ncbi:peroxisomal carnitine O-octanoyltransferase isoform X6 [Nerophis ophidion]|uniref:peroxisomal carnitine O-octanoyltransferase isoform X6 n=1 Tax=Nerophis ophidion TaxID=159077 RepID=UPI002ADF95D8|nr:peroxisomal carnitine O-octanoyltransferase isoform X6 [Nerophis ophidion]
MKADDKMTNHLSESPQERTFQYQSSLPPLPVPSLEGSLSKYLDAVRPFASETEFHATVDVVQKFQEGIGQELHHKLLQRAKTRRNWGEPGAPESWKNGARYGSVQNAVLHLQSTWS